MNYRVNLKPRAEKDFQRLQRQEQQRIVEKLRFASDDLHGDVKRLVQFQPAIGCASAIIACSSKSNPIKLSFTESCIGARLTVDRTL